MVRTSAEVPTWELESIVPGGPGGAEFHRRRDAIAGRLALLRERARTLPPLAQAGDAWAGLIRELDPVKDDLGELASFAVCAAATDARSPAARAAEAAIDDVRLVLDEVGVALTAAIDAADDAAFAAFLARPELSDAVPWLRDVRKTRHLRLPPALEALRVAMEREAVMGWGRLYDLVSGGLTAAVTAKGETRVLGIAEVAAMRADPDPEVRRAAFEAGERAWSSVAEVCAHTLTQITGNRQQHVDRLGVDELAFTTNANRVRRETLEALWAAADAARPALVRYLGHKAKVLGKQKLEWWDLDAPLPLGDGDPGVDWHEATAQILASFDAFHPELGAFGREALERRWVDAAPREGRRQGGFCTDFPRSDASRIFMTFTGTLDNAQTLAHELGHAYHNRVLAKLPPTRTRVTSALAETASTFAEAVFRDHVLSNAEDDRLRAFMLDQQLQASVAFLMDIPHRFRIERECYRLRRQGVLEADRLTAVTVEAQRACYGDALASWNPLFWASKLHFYIPEFGFYNWPYTFGYLFSAAVYARAKAEGQAFLPTLHDLLRRTGWQDTEELARDVLGVDLTDPSFWRSVVAPIDGWVDGFVDATR